MVMYMLHNVTMTVILLERAQGQMDAISKSYNTPNHELGCWENPNPYDGVVGWAGSMHWKCPEPPPRYHKFVAHYPNSLGNVQVSGYG